MPPAKHPISLPSHDEGRAGGEPGGSGRDLGGPWAFLWVRTQYQPSPGHVRGSQTILKEEILAPLGIEGCQIRGNTSPQSQKVDTSQSVPMNIKLSNAHNVRRVIVLITVL